MTEAELADALRVSVKTVSSWLGGQSFGQGANLLLLARYFDVSLDWLALGLGADDDPVSLGSSRSQKTLEEDLEREILSETPDDLQEILARARVDVRRAIQRAREKLHEEARAFLAEEQQLRDALQDESMSSVLRHRVSIEQVAKRAPREVARELVRIATRMANDELFLPMLRAHELPLPMIMRSGGELLLVEHSTAEDMVLADHDPEAIAAEDENPAGARLWRVTPGKRGSARRVRAADRKRE